MARRFEGKVAFITGVARGQGRNHAVAFAEEGGSVIGVDLPEAYSSLSYNTATVADLDATVDLVEQVGGAMVAVGADVRNKAALEAALAVGIDHFGRLDLVVANAGICSVQRAEDVTDQLWAEVIDTNLTGVWNTFVASIAHLEATGGGCMVATSSTAGIKGLPYFGPYVAAKHAVTGIVRNLANELADRSIRVNAVLPTGVATEMTAGLGALGPLLSARPELNAMFQNALPVPMVDLQDVTEAVLFLGSDAARYITGLELTVNAGSTIR